MAGEVDARIIADFAQEISSKLNEAAIIARTANGLEAEGFSDRAFQTLLECEPLLHDALTLLNASSIVRRRDRLQGAAFS